MGRPTSPLVPSFRSPLPGPGSLLSSPRLSPPAAMDAGDDQPPVLLDRTARATRGKRSGSLPGPDAYFPPGGWLLIEIEIVPLFQDNQAPRGRGRPGRGFLEPRGPQGCRSQTVPTRSFLSLLFAALDWCRCRSYWGISLGFLISDLCSFASSFYHVHTHRCSVLHLSFLMCCHFLAGGER